jgi:addiction module HigA family antidote
MAIQKSKRLQPLHPGEVLKELLSEAGLTVNSLSLALRVPAKRTGGIVKGQRGITGDTSVRLARHFGTSAQMWMNLQRMFTSEAK